MDVLTSLLHATVPIIRRKSLWSFYDNALNQNSSHFMGVTNLSSSVYLSLLL